MNNTDSQIKQAAEIIKNAKHCTAFTGAGISVESGIPPFRGQTGLWAKYDPKVLDLQHFHQQPLAAWKVIRELFYDFFGKAKPNKAHYVLAKMEANGLLNSIITQNIDNLHQAAGSQKVYEFHGTASYLIDLHTGQRFTPDQLDMNNLPVRSPKNGNVLKPDFIFFGEAIPPVAYKKSMEEAENADVFIVVGTTGEIIPASYIPQQAKQNGATIIEINPDDSAFSHSITDVHLKLKASQAFEMLEKELEL